MIKDFSVSVMCKDSTFKISQSEDYSKLVNIKSLFYLYIMISTFSDDVNP